MRSYLEYLTKKLGIKKNVEFLGYVSEARKLTCFAAADVFVIPSVIEPFGLVAIEALASGLPIVASRVGGIPEIVKDGVNGFLVQPRNPDEIADAAIRLLTNEKLSKKIRADNREKAKKYDWNVVIAQYLDLYYKLIT